jgi:anti-sigma factor RsiW
MKCPQEVNVGAFVLGVLEPEETARLEHHLVQCARCQRTRGEFAELPGLLAKVSVHDVTAPSPAPSEVAFASLRADVVRRRPHRAPWYAAAAAAAALVLAGLGGWVAASRTAVAPLATVTGSSGAVHASARFAATRDGTAITLALSGVMPGETCRLVAIAKDGHRETASTWTASYDGTATVRGTVAMSTRGMDHLVIETVSGATLVTLSAP